MKTAKGHHSPIKGVATFLFFTAGFIRFTGCEIDRKSGNAVIINPINNHRFNPVVVYFALKLARK